MKRTSRKIFTPLTLLTGVLMLFYLTSCEKVESPTMEYDYVYFTCAAKGPSTLDSGNPDAGVPAISNTLGFFQQSLYYTRDTVIRLGIFCSGTQMPKGSVNVTIAIDNFLLDSLVYLGSAVDGTGNKLYPSYAYNNYQVLAENQFSLGDLNLVIPKGQVMVYLDVTIKTTLLDPAKQYILPLRISNVEGANINPKYNKLLYSPLKK